MSEILPDLGTGHHGDRRRDHGVAPVLGPHGSEAVGNGARSGGNRRSFATSGASTRRARPRVRTRSLVFAGGGRQRPSSRKRRPSSKEGLRSGLVASRGARQGPRWPGHRERTRSPRVDRSGVSNSVVGPETRHRGGPLVKAVIDQIKLEFPQKLSEAQ